MDEENAAVGPLVGHFARCQWCGARDGFSVGEVCLACGTRREDEPDGRGEGEFTIRLHGLVSGVSSDLDGLYLASYHPRQEGRSPTGLPLMADVQVTDDSAKALRFRDASAARAEWMRWDGTDRPDGKPSRPLTAFNVEMAKTP